jgi:hypothetical protein
MSEQQTHTAHPEKIIIPGLTPTIFPDSVGVLVSTKADGNVLDRAVGIHNPFIVTNRTEFCRRNGLSYGDMVFQRIIYDGKATYELISEVDDRSTTKFTDEIVADALFTKRPGVGMLLPLADCIPTILFDPENDYLAMAHMGRHSTLTELLPRLVEHFKSEGSDPSKLLVWMGPSAQRASYRMDYFHQENDPAWKDFFDKKPDGYYLDMQGFNRKKLESAGILSNNIEVSPIDTVTHPELPSHSAGDLTTRFAVIALMKSTHSSHEGDRLPLAA